MAADIAVLRSAVVDGDADAVRRHAHRIKGASQTVGTHGVTTVAERLEAAASTSVDDRPSLRTTAEELEVAKASLGATLSGVIVQR